MSQAFYNEIDPFAAAWLRKLIERGVIAPGVVDERSIEDIRPDELSGFTQCHFFAGIGVWSYALRCAGWPDDRPVWTGSCPCQPFSSAGKRGGTADERHLWPAWFHLISQCKPVTVFGEQVASKDGLGWLDLVHADMAGAGYSVGAVDMCAAGLGAPHIRQRLWFVADRGGLAHPESHGRRGWGDGDQAGNDGPVQVAGRSTVGNVDDTIDPRLEGLSGHGNDRDEPRRHGADRGGPIATTGPVNGFWRNAAWLPCRDGKARPVKSGSFPLVNGSSAGVVRGGDSGLPFDADNTPEARVMRLRGYGNAIVGPVAEAWIKAYMDETFQAL